MKIGERQDPFRMMHFARQTGGKLSIGKLYSFFAPLFELTINGLQGSVMNTDEQKIVQETTDINIEVRRLVIL